MANIKIKKLLSSIVMDVITDGKPVNKQVLPGDEVTVSEDTLANLKQLNEAYEVVDNKIDVKATIDTKKTENKINSGTDEKDKK
ncbi:MAG: hypothetical protein HOP31_08850 [Ignavibacteria bacterium]|nr:hypothetical protein [Ignavibacteria bacterium]